ncbi:flagellar hook-associated protein FlgK [Curvibacter sp. HBC61]|uniref:Flagellar hook-associated protein 1 n=1 Tax=Curvibacter cyanobacteriorum TaxID=3026422 RepID=A0ABT5N1G3_9BURK|nr:flagellar hook-associated protein FlgK [Curvibacter sp. HBC61]MDD0840149.1 flagellar hook-associated protein FlgK [Curvibacter sp. HBC61]
MSGGLLNLGARALMSNQVALQVTGNNISNVNTAGYSRQTAVLSAVQGEFTGSGYIGKGVEVSTVQRIYDQFLAKQATATASIKALDVTRAEKVAQMEDIFVGGTNGLGQAINNTINAFSDVANAPSDLTARTVAITQTQEMAARFKSASNQLSDLQQNAQLQLRDDETVINAMAEQLASLNAQIAFALSSGQPPNDLLDKRDSMLNQLNQKVQTTTVPADDGSLNVFLANQPLVLGSKSATVSFSQPTNYPGDQNTLKLKITQSGGQVTEIDENSLSGGEVIGLLRFHNTDLAEARNLLGRMALAVTTEMNTQHVAGVDLNGNAGTNLFNPIGISAIAATGNSTATVNAFVANDSQLQLSDYKLTFGAGGVISSVTRLSDNANVTPAPATTLPITIDGLTIQAGTGTPANGDTFMLRPYDQAAQQIQVAIASPSALAVANPVQATLGTQNTGTMTIGSLKADPAVPTGSPLGYQASVHTNSPMAVKFVSSSQYQLVNPSTGALMSATTYTYTPGQAIPPSGDAASQGWTLTLTGTPKAGDSVVVVRPSTATDLAAQKKDGGNAKSLYNLSTKPTYDKTPLSDTYAALMAQIGVRSQSAQYAADVSSSIANNAEAARTSVSGVNLDEEAAHLLQFQQAYQASAKIIQTAQSIFDTLLQTMR